MSSDEVLVKVEGVSKKFCKELRRSLRYGLQDVLSEILLQHQPSPELRRREFWALQDVSFELKRGESFGLIGVNGSGKTTLLKMLQGLIKPTTGKITVRGKVGALISLGQGFQPLLTGRENIFINAAILGIPKAEVYDKMDEILEFADLGDFIDAPVKTYSSGMKGRLGFSIATNLVVPDVLLLDEVLATGDWKFKERCFQRMEEIVNSGATIVFVSHLVPKVERLCNRAILLHKGVVKAIGPASEVCEAYHAMPNSYDGRIAREKRKQFILAAKRKLSSDEADEGYDETGYDEYEDVEPIQIHKIELLNREYGVQEHFRTLDSLVVRIRFSAEQPLNTLRLVVQFLMLGDEITIAGFEHTFDVDSDDPPEEPATVDCTTVDCTIPELQLREGKYRVSVTLSDREEDDDNRPSFKATDMVRLAVKRNPELDIRPKLSPGMVYMPASWRLDTQNQADAPNLTLNASAVASASQSRSNGDIPKGNSSKNELNEDVLSRNSQ